MFGDYAGAKAFALARTELAGWILFYMPDKTYKSGTSSGHDH